MLRVRTFLTLIKKPRVVSRLGQHLPRTFAHWLSALLIWAVLAIFLQGWFKYHWTELTNPDLQQDDARTAIFQYHRFEPGGAFKDDPIANEMLAYQPMFLSGLYFVFVKATNLFVAIKLVQLVCLLIIVGAAYVLYRAKRHGLLGAALLLFLFFRDWWVVNRIAGGLPRGFAFPCFALWFSGALASQGGVRRLAIVLSGLTYPPAMAILLAGEGIFVMANRFLQSPSYVLAGIKHYAITVILAVLAVAPSVLGGDSKDGPIYSLEEAKQEPAFGRGGRLWVIPFDEPRHVFAWEFASTFMPQGLRPLAEVAKPFDEHLPSFAFVLISALLTLSVVGLSARPIPTVAFCCGCVIMFFAACYWAFHLYSPERFYSFGMHIGGLLLVLDVMATFGERFRAPIRYPLRNFVGAFAMGGMCLFLGTGYGPQLKITDIKRSDDRPLNDFVASLPPTVRIAGHPLDSDDIPFWAARATMGGFETLQPWMKGSWARQKARVQDTFSALYATDRGTVLDYAKRNHVTHFLINRTRYDSDFVAKARTFEPLNSFFNTRFGGLSYQSLVFRQVPQEAVVFTYGRFQVVSVERLAQAWATAPKGS